MLLIVHVPSSPTMTDLIGKSDETVFASTFTQASTVGYSWSTVWDTSRLDHESQYEIRVRAYDGEDYSEEFVKRIHQIHHEQ